MDCKLNKGTLALSILTIIKQFTSKLKISFKEAISFNTYILIFFIACFAHEARSTTQIIAENTSLDVINSVISDEIKSDFQYSGLAAYYNKINAYIINNNKHEKLPEEEFVSISKKQHLTIIGHHKVMIITNLNALVSLSDQNLILKTGNPHHNIKMRILRKSQIGELEQHFKQLSYIHLWPPLRLLCIKIETVFKIIHSLHSYGWGITILIFSLCFKLFILPLNLLQAVHQRRCSLIQSDLAKEQIKIKKHFQGEEAHKLYLDAHKKLGVTPFYSLKPLVLSFVPIPFWICIFNVLGEIDLLKGQSFLWIDDLTEPDMAIKLNFGIPLFDHSINILPILMTAIAVYAAVKLKNNLIPRVELMKQKKKLYLMSLCFFVIFYPFPSSMVLYWTLSNLWSSIQQRFIR